MRFETCGRKRTKKSKWRNVKGAFFSGAFTARSLTKVGRLCFSFVLLLSVTSDDFSSLTRISSALGSEGNDRIVRSVPSLSCVGCVCATRQVPLSVPQTAAAATPFPHFHSQSRGRPALRIRPAHTRVPRKKGKTRSSFHPRRDSHHRSMGS